MYLLDTDVTSQRTKTEPVASVTAWLREAWGGVGEVLRHGTLLY